MFLDLHPDWQRAGEAVVAQLLQDHGEAGLRPDTLGLVAFGTGPRPPGFVYRGDWRCYPCSLVKAFHLVHALAAIEAGEVRPHAELDRALADMILWSSNTATNYVIDLLTGTTGDTMLDGAAWDAFLNARQGLDRWFAALGWPEWQGATIVQKLMDDTRYGREKQMAGPNSEHLNALNPALCARLMHALWTPGALPLGEAMRQRAIAMMAREPAGPLAADPRYQLSDYLAPGMPHGARIWSKAGHNEWTGDAKASWFRHDMLRVEPPEGPARVFVIMTQGEGIAGSGGSNRLPSVGRALWEAFGNLPDA